MRWKPPFGRHEKRLRLMVELPDGERKYLADDQRLVEIPHPVEGREWYVTAGEWCEQMRDVYE